MRVYIEPEYLRKYGLGGIKHIIENYNKLNSAAQGFFFIRNGKNRIKSDDMRNEGIMLSRNMINYALHSLVTLYDKSLNSRSVHLYSEDDIYTLINKKLKEDRNYCQNIASYLTCTIISAYSDIQESHYIKFAHLSIIDTMLDEEIRNMFRSTGKNYHQVLNLLIPENTFTKNNKGDTILDQYTNFVIDEYHNIQLELFNRKYPTDVDKIEQLTMWEFV